VITARALTGLPEIVLIQDDRAQKFLQSFPGAFEPLNGGLRFRTDGAQRVDGLEAPLTTGEDGKVVLEAIYAGYASAGLGHKVTLPYKPTAERPVDEWLNRKKA